MALDRSNLVTLAKTTALAKPTSAVAYSFGETKYSYADLNDTLRSEINELVGTYQLYRENKNQLFALMEEVITDVLPVKVMEQYGSFAEIKTYGQGVRPIFTQKITEASKKRAKQFVTKVGLAGRYEVFKLDGRSYEVTTSAYGAACQLGIEEFLDGRMDFATLLDIVMEGLDDKIYMEIANALIGSVATLQAANKYSGNSFVEEEMDALLQVADSYGSGNSTIYCTFEFASKMIPAEAWVSDAMKDQMWSMGRLANYKGHQVIVLRQSFTDETNTTKVIDPSYAWIIPGGAEKPIKIAFEGPTLMKEIESQDDWSRDLQFYKKIGVAAIIYNDICVYRNESLTVER
jgi:hypothetical protein